MRQQLTLLISILICLALPPAFAASASATADFVLQRVIDPVQTDLALKVDAALDGKVDNVGCDGLQHQVTGGCVAVIEIVSSHSAVSASVSSVSDPDPAFAVYKDERNRDQTLACNCRQAWQDYRGGGVIPPS